MGCTNPYKNLKLILETRENFDRVWYTKNPLTCDSCENFTLYSSEDLLDNQNPGICPKIKLLFANNALLTSRVQRLCEGGEPPKGDIVSNYDADYSIENRYKRKVLIIKLKSGTRVFYINLIKSMTNNQYLIKLSRN